MTGTITIVAVRNFRLDGIACRYGDQLKVSPPIARQLLLARAVEVVTQDSPCKINPDRLAECPMRLAVVTG